MCCGVFSVEDTCLLPLTKSKNVIYQGYLNFCLLYSTVQKAKAPNKIVF